MPREALMTKPQLVQSKSRPARRRGTNVVAAAALLAAIGGGACSSMQSLAANAGADAGAAADTAPSRASLVVSDGYVMAGPWAGGGFTATDPGAATITPACTSATCTPAFTGNEFCMHGTVTGRPDYTGFAMLGWDVSQPAGGTAATWAVPDSGGITVTVLDAPPSTALRVQLQGTNPHDGSDRWCAALVSGKPIAWSDFKTNCWVGGTPQNALAPGTPIQQGSIIVPGLLTDLPFDVCLIDIQFQQ
jgi:hypothetical protein